MSIFKDHLALKHNASEILYDNTVSGLTSINMQGAVEEINTILTPPGISTHATLPTSLIAYWSSDVSGSFPDATGNGHNGTINGAIFNACGKVAGDYIYNGVGDYINVPDHNDLSFTDGAGNDQPFSISLWLKTNGVPGGTQYIFTKGDAVTNGEWYLYVGTSGTSRIQFYLNTDPGLNRIGVISAYGTLPQNTWTHVVMTYDGSKTVGGINIYIDGVSISTTSDTSGSYAGIVNTAIDVKLGASAVPSLYFDGDIDETGIWSKELTSVEVTDLYNSGSGLAY